MTKHIRLGILTPSSNTALEPLTQAIVSSINAQFPALHVTAHFARFPVTQISLSPAGLAQFTGPGLDSILAAAELLSHARVDVIGWSGTSAGWLGFDADAELCRAIEQRTGGVPATTSVLALNKVLAHWGVQRLALVTPYTDDVQARIVANYKALGVEIGEGMERHLGVLRNTDIADIQERVLDGLVEEVVDGGRAGGGGVDAVTTFCTNLVAAQRVESWEAKHGVPVLDTVTTVVWDMLRECGLDLKSLKGWGKIFTIG